MCLHDNTETHGNHHSIILCIVMNDLAYILRADFTHKNIVIMCLHNLHEPIFHNRGNKKCYFANFFTHKTLQTVTACFFVVLNHVFLTWLFTLWFSFHFCVCVAFGLVLLFTVAFGTPYAFAHTFHTIAISLG